MSRREETDGATGKNVSARLDRIAYFVGGKRTANRPPDLRGGHLVAFVTRWLAHATNMTVHFAVGTAYTAARSRACGPFVGTPLLQYAEHRPRLDRLHERTSQQNWKRQMGTRRWFKSLRPRSRSPAAKNRFWSDYAYHRGDLVLRNKPEIVSIEATNYCNIKCVMCPRGEPDIMQRPLGYMDDALLDRIVDQIDFLQDQTCWLHWFGEPLMNPRIFRHIEVAKRKIANLGISTNATLLRDAEQDALLESPLDVMMIAIDGATKDVYERVRKSARFTFEEVSYNAERFLAKRKARGQVKPTVWLSIIVMNETARP